jgi:acetyl-CoA hydrolase
VLAPSPSDPVRSRIAELVAALIPADATLQVGIGSLAEEIVAAVGPRPALRFHTGTLPNAARRLLGELEGRASAPEVRHVATSVAPDAGGAQWPGSVTLRPVSETHAPETLAAAHRLWAVNSGLSVDLTGAVNAEWIGEDRTARGGGQLDFARAAAHAERGGSVIALASRTSRGESRIVASLSEAHAPTTAGEHVGFVVTEHGIAALEGLGPEARAEALIAVAHPDDRASLREAIC